MSNSLQELYARGSLFHRSRAREMMEDLGLDVLVALSPVNVRYLTGHWNSLETTFTDYMMMVNGSAAMTFAPAASFDGSDISLISHALTSMPPPDEGVTTVPFGSAGLAASRVGALAAVLSSREGGPRRVGVDLDGCSAREWTEIRTALPGSILLDASVVFRFLRSVKTEWEVTCAERAVLATEAAMMACAQNIRPGGSQEAIVSEYQRELLGHGAESEHVSFGLQGQGVAQGGFGPFAVNDVFLFDVGARLHGIVTDTGTTVALGAMTAAQRDAFSQVKACVQAGADLLAPGTPVSVVGEAMSAAIRTAWSGLVSPSGHGVGIEPKEYPFIGGTVQGRYADQVMSAEAADVELMPGMVINLECPITIPGEWSVHTERTFAITEVGVRELTPAGSREEPIFIEVD